jgi:murein L,D-transpeptidase YafK
VGPLQLRRDFPEKTAFLGIALLLAFLALAQPLKAAISGPIPLEAGATTLAPDSLLYFPHRNPGYALLVEKSSQKAYLYQSAHLDSPFRIYPCSTGENSGPKRARNDKRTPEGIYYITGSFKEQELAPIYGARAFPIDYPNPLDTRLGRKGYGIWIHGTNEPLKPRDTNGCIVFRNKDILELSQYLSQGHTPIIVTQKISFVEKKALQDSGAAFKELVTEWVGAWKEGRIARYMSFYGKDFAAQGKDWHQWRAHKKRLSEKYGTIDIGIENLQILRENGIAMARFMQTYRADGFFSKGEKRLYLMKKSPEWKITYEFFTKQRGPAVKDPAEESKQRELLAINRLISRWKKAWQDKDLNGYMTAYAEDFISLGLDRDGWRRHKSKINRRYREIRVEFRNLKIRLWSQKKATVSFDQEYRSDMYYDRGKKTIQLVKRNGKWKIKTEKWVPLRGKRAR